MGNTVSVYEHQMHLPNSITTSKIDIAKLNHESNCLQKKQYFFLTNSHQKMILYPCAHQQNFYGMNLLTPRVLKTTLQLQLDPCKPTE